MPVSTGAVATTDSYPADQEVNAAIIGPFQKIATVQFTVSTALVTAQIAKLNAKDNSLHWDPFEVSFAPGVSGYSGEVHGIRFRSAVAGTPASIIINGYFSDDPVPFTDPQPIDGSFSPDGSWTPAGGSGIMFDESPQEGTYLDVTTTGVDGDGLGINLTDTGGGGASLVATNGGYVTINADGAGDVNIGQAGDIVTIGGESPQMDGPEGSVVVDSPSGTVYMNEGTFSVEVVKGVGIKLIGLPTAPGAAGTLWNNAGVVTVA